jgi:hypothetical protein
MSILFYANKLMANFIIPNLEAQESSSYLHYSFVSPKPAVGHF